MSFRPGIRADRSVLTDSQLLDILLKHSHDNVWSESMKKPAVIFGTTLVVAVLSGYGATSASAATPAPTPGIVTVCAGNTVKLTDDQGAPLSAAAQAGLLAAIEHICQSGTAPAGVGPQPLASRIGYLAAHISVAPGLLSFHTTASSMPTGYTKTLVCSYKLGSAAAGGLGLVPWQDCGSASGTGSSLSTRTNAFCPMPGLAIEVVADLEYKGTYDESSAFAITQ
jgi:hypothetical protein